MKLVTDEQSSPKFEYEINCDQCSTRVESAVAFETLAGGDIFVCFPCLEKALKLRPAS